MSQQSDSEGLCNNLQQSTPFTTAPSSRPLQFNRGAISHPISHRFKGPIFTGKKGDRRMQGRQRILFQDLYYPKEERRLAASLEPSPLESVNRRPQIQDGNTLNNLSHTEASRLADQHRLGRRISTRTCHPSAQEVPSIPLEQQTVSIQDNTFRSFFIPSRIHQGSSVKIK